MKRTSVLFSNILILAFFVTQVFPQTGTAVKTIPHSSKDATVNQAAAKTPVTGEQIEQDVNEALTVIENNYVTGKKTDAATLYKSSIDSMLHTLDPHSNYFDAKETEAFRTEQSSQYFGIGASIGGLRDADGKDLATYIRATFDGSPANKAGLRYGDKILDVNGISMLGKPSPEVSKNLRGERGTIAKVTVEHYGTGEKETVSIIRDAVPQPSVPEAYMIRPGIGYIAMIGGFHQTTYNEFIRDLTSLKRQGMQQLILDLRENGGGLVNQAYQVANTFLSNGQTVFSQKGRIEGTVGTYPAENDNPDKTPMVVLVNGNTASASEILSGALQDHDRALIVGENTFGKGLVQNPFAIEDGSMLLLTIAKYYTPSGRLIQRDYSNGDLYAYYYKGGSLSDETKPPALTGTQQKTDTGRTVYGGVGIVPDEVVKAATITTARFNEQVKLVDPIFAYAMDLTFGKAPGFDAYKVDRPIVFNYDLKSNDFPVTDNLYQALKKYAADKYKIAPAEMDKEREFVERYLRAELATAAYGVTTPRQIFNENDNQIARAIELLPRAKQLALESDRINAQKTHAMVRP